MKNSHQTRPIFQTILCPFVFFVLFVVKKLASYQTRNIGSIISDQLGGVLKNIWLACI